MLQSTTTGFSSLSAEYRRTTIRVADTLTLYSSLLETTSGHTRCPRRSSEHSFALNSDRIGTCFTFAYHWNDIVPGAEHHSILSTRTMHEAHTVRRKRSRRCRVAPSIFVRHYRAASRHSRRGTFAHSRVFRRSNHVDVTRNCTERRETRLHGRSRTEAKIEVREHNAKVNTRRVRFRASRYPLVCFRAASNPIAFSEQGRRRRTGTSSI